MQIDTAPQFKDPAAGRATVLADIQQRIATLQAVENSLDLILAWDNGLGVKWTPGGQVFACGIENAETVATDETPEEAWAFIPKVTNGKNEAAKIIRRGIAAKRDIEACRGLLVYFGG